jgi:hypothetical protein
LYLVVNDFGKFGRAVVETEIAEADWETVLKFPDRATFTRAPSEPEPSAPLYKRARDLAGPILPVSEAVILESAIAGGGLRLAASSMAPGVAAKVVAK